MKSSWKLIFSYPPFFSSTDKHFWLLLLNYYQLYRYHSNHLVQNRSGLCQLVSLSTMLTPEIYMETEKQEQTNNNIDYSPKAIVSGLKQSFYLLSHWLTLRPLPDGVSFDIAKPFRHELAAVLVSVAAFLASNITYLCATEMFSSITARAHELFFISLHLLPLLSRTQDIN